MARLVHAEPGARVVEVSARREGHTLGSALGEGATAEAAEERALERLRQRLGIAGGAGNAGSQGVELPVPRRSGPTAPPLPRRPDLAPDPAPAAVSAPPPQPGQPSGQPPPAEEPRADPEDWSGELAQIDLQLRRIGWGREQEGLYLERAFGHPSRSRITTFSDLMAYLQVLQGLPDGSDPAQAPVPLRRLDLLAQCDQLLAGLGWDATRGRRVLEQHFGLASRQQLSDTQLLAFNMHLEEALIQAGSGAPASQPSTGAGP